MRRGSDKAARRRNDVAVYAPYASEFYDISDPVPGGWGGGGAAFQASQLARGLAARGMRVAHIVFPVRRRSDVDSNLELVEREWYQDEGLLRAPRDLLAIWASLRDADATVYILRGFGLHLLVGAAFGRLRRRRVIFSGSSDLDFSLDRRGLGPVRSWLYRRALRSVDAAVVQTAQQRTLAARVLKAKTKLVHIPSFAIQAEPARGERVAFLWTGRIVSYKRPLEFVRLAEAVPEAHFWMVCLETVDTDHDLLAETKARAAPLPNLELLAPLPPDQLLELMGRAVAVVGTSEAEGMPNVFLEAWSRGIPALTLSFDPDGIVAAEQLGVAAMGSWDRFVDGARGLWMDADLRAGMAGNAVRYVRRVHLPSAVIAKWRELLGSIDSALR